MHLHRLVSTMSYILLVYVNHVECFELPVSFLCVCMCDIKHNVLLFILDHKDSPTSVVSLGTLI